jgi:hypothetical protein
MNASGTAAGGWVMAGILHPLVQAIVRKNWDGSILRA